MAKDVFQSLSILLGLHSLLLKSSHFLLLLIQEVLKLFQVVHKDSSTFKGSFLNDDLRFWEKSKESFEDVLRNAEECGFVLFGSLFLEIFFSTDFNHKVGSEIKHELVFTKE